MEKGIKERAQYIFVSFLAVAVFVKVVLISLAYPIFSPVDEASHYDMIVKYSKGYFFQKNINFEPEVYLMLLVKGTKGYIAKKEGGVEDSRTYTGKISDMPDYVKTSILEKNPIIENQETAQGPVYYWLLSYVYRFARSLGVDDVDMVYCLRSFNGLVMAALVMFSFVFAKRFFPGDIFLALGAPLVIAFLPQDAFFQIGNDALSPLVSAISFYFLFGLIISKKIEYPRYIMAGIFSALALLTKYTNIPVYIIMLAAIYNLFKPRANNADKEKRIKAVTLMAASSALPIILWAARNLVVFGDITGSAHAVSMLGWAVKPLGQMIAHPLFLGDGVIIFFRDLFVKIWRGELVWHSVPLANAATDSYYFISTAVFLSWDLAHTLRSGRKMSCEALLHAAVMPFFLMLLCISVVFDFGNCYYPSRLYPYFTSGRLILGALVPFVLIYLKGFRLFCGTLKIRKSGHLLALIAFITIIINLSDIKANMHVFRSQRNWYYYQ